MQFVDFGMEKDPNCKLNALHISVSSLCEDFILSSLNVEDDLLLDDGNLEIESFLVSDRAESSPNLIEFDGIVADIN